MPHDITVDERYLGFGIKAVQERERDGQAGLVLQGYASRYNEIDRDGEYQVPGSLLDSLDTFFLRERPPLWLEHGLDPAVGPREIGYVTDYRFDDDGLFVEAFVPRDIADAWRGPSSGAAKKRFAQAYEEIKAGALRSFSVGGHFLRRGKALLKWAITELTVCRSPSLPSATFTLAEGAKALSDAYEQASGVRRAACDGAADAEPMADAEALLPHASPLTPAGEEGGAVKGSQTQSGADVTMAPLCVPAGHVTVSAPVVNAAGTQQWTLSYGTGATASAVLDAGAGEKAADAPLKSEPDGAKHPKSHYLYTPSDQVSTWKLRVRDAQGDLDPRLLGACHAALTVGYRGQKVDLPDDEKQRCLTRLKALYKQAGLDWPEDEESKSGKKAEQELLADALAVLQQFEQGRKAGRTHSAATLYKVQQVISLLEEHFGLGDDDSDEDAAENEDDDSEAPLS